MVVRALKILPILAAALVLCGCSRFAAPPSIVIAGATLIDGTSAPPIANSVFVITGEKIAAMGDPSTVPIAIPETATHFDGKGWFIYSTDPAQPIRVGAPATFLLLSVNPALEPDYDQKIIGRMREGRWIQFPQ